MTPEVEQAVAVAEVVAAFFGNTVSMLTLYVSTVSGYLLVAYLVGAKLTTMQCTIITGLFTVFELLITFGAVRWMLASYNFAATYGAGGLTSWVPAALGVLLVSGILASLKFMWDVRNSKEAT